MPAQYIMRLRVLMRNQQRCLERLYARMLYWRQDLLPRKEWPRMDNSRSRRWVFPRLATVSLLVMAIGLLLGCAPPENPFTITPRTGPPPPPYTWTRVTPPPTTAQQAYAQSMSNLRLCEWRAALSATMTWLVAGPTHGVALALADCSNIWSDARQGMAVISVSLDTDIQPHCPAWVLEQAMLTTQPPISPALDAAGNNIPPWLPLPTDGYLAIASMPSPWTTTLNVWQSRTRLFVAGRFAGSATRPAGAETISIDGRSGWQVTDHDIVSVTVPVVDGWERSYWQVRDHDIVTVTIPLAGGWTFFFSGTADTTTIQRLAGASLSHLDTLLPKPLPTPTDYPQPTPAC